MTRRGKWTPAHWALRKIFLLQTAYPMATLLTAIVLAALSVVYTVQNLEFQTSQKDLISPKERLIQLAEQVRQFGHLDSFVVVMEGSNPRRSLEFLRALVPQLEKDKANYQDIFYRVDPQNFRKWALLYLDRKDLGRMVEGFREHSRLLEGLTRTPKLVHFFEQINEEMAERMVGELFTGFLNEPSHEPPRQTLNLAFLIQTLREMDRFLGGDENFTSPWNSLLSGQSWGDEFGEGYFWTRDKRYLLLFITPTTKDDFAGTWHSLRSLRNAIAREKSAFPDVHVGVTGPEALNADQMNTALGDMSLATLLSLGGLAGLLILFWRGVRRPLLEMIQLLIALSLTFGFTTLAIGHLNILSVTFAPLLLGLGIDYGVHWFARYQEEEQKTRRPKKEILQATMERLGPGVLLAGLSAALSFFPLVLTGFKGLVELGIICSVGLAITTATTLIVLPSLILLFDHPRPRGDLSSVPSELKPFWSLSRRRVAVLLAGGVTASVLSLWGAPNVKFDLNMLHLQSSRVESVVWEEKLLAGSEFSSIYGEILARSLEEVRQKTRALEALPSVSRVESLETLIPQDQEEKLALLREMKPLLAQVRPFQPAPGPVSVADLEKVLGRIRFKMLEASASEGRVEKPLQSQMIEVRTLIDRLQGKFRAGERSRITSRLNVFQRDLFRDLKDKLDILRSNVSSSPMRVGDLPSALRERFVSPGNFFLIRVFPKENIWQPDLLGRFVHDLRSVDPDAIGDPVTLFVFTKAFRDGCIRAATYAVIFIFTFLLFTFRDIRSTFLALVPLIVGTVWTVGFMDVFGVSLNLANSLFLPLVVGAGVEYGIIIIHRWRQREKGIIPLPFSTGMGVVLAGLTTTVGFCSLMISAHRGIFSLGLLTTVGSLTILAAAVLFLPAVLHYWESGRGAKRPD